MTLSVGKSRVPLSVSVYFAAMIALCFAAGSVAQIGLGLFFAALHELGHLAAMSLCKAKPSRVCLTAAGVRIERAPGLSLGFGQEIAIALAGPAVSLVLGGLCAAAYLARPGELLLTCAAINLGFGLFNLLPVRQLDGGRVLYFALCRRGSESAASRICFGVSLLCLFAGTAGAALLCLRQGLNVSLVVAVVYLAGCC